MADASQSEISENVGMKFKYPRTPHLPWSPSVASDDTRMVCASTFEGRNVVITEKLDGENTTLYRDGLHARSLDPRPHPSRDWVKRFWSEIAFQIPQGWRLCGENMYATHSIAYVDLESYFYLFSVWDDSNNCLSWEDTCFWAQKWGIPIPRILYRGVWNEARIRALSLHMDTTQVEGYVVRSEDGFPYAAFEHHVGKWVRKDHIQTDHHWSTQYAINQLRQK